MSSSHPDLQKSSRVEVAHDDARAPYEPPRLMKKRAVARVTLFSGGFSGGTFSLHS